MPEEKAMTNNALKAISRTDEELRVANYIVLFGGRDLEGEYFAPETELESSYTKTGRLYVDFEHGLGKHLDGDDAPGPDDVLGWVDWKTVKRDENGVWVERVLSRRNEYMQFIEELIEEGIIGNSSEAVPSGVKRADDGKIEVWPLRRDTLTVTPMEPRMLSENVVSALKSLAEVQPHLKALLPEAAGSGDAGATDGRDEGRITVSEEKHMDKDKVEITLEEYRELIQGQQSPQVEPEAELDEEAEQKHAQIADLQAQLDEVTEMIAKSPALKDAGYTAPDSETDHAESKSFGDFLVSIRLGNKKRLAEVYGTSFEKWDTDGLPDHQKAALAEGSGTTGGYTVPVEFGGPIETRANQRVILRVAGAPVEPMTSRSKELWLLDVETAPSAGSSAFAGGVVGYWISEAGSITESEPQFRLVELVAHKLAAYSLASSEVRDDARASVDGILGNAFSEELAAQENYAHFRGDGVGKPLGILNSSAWNAGSRSAASTIALADLATMEGQFLGDVNEGVYVVNTAAFKELVELVSNPLAFLNSMRENIPMTLLGRPLFRYGGLPALNTAGDIMLVNPNYYVIGERSGLQIAFSEHFKFQNDQLAWRVTRRIDGQPAIDNGVTLENASTVVYPFSGLAAG